MHVSHTRIFSLLIVIGLVVPAMQVAGHSCRGDACQSHRQAAPSCSDAGEMKDSCCSSQSEDDEAENEDDGCCSDGGCDCMCCGAPVITVMDRFTPIRVTIAPRSVPVVICRSALRPQDAVGALLQPPQA